MSGNLIDVSRTQDCIKGISSSLITDRPSQVFRGILRTMYTGRSAGFCGSENHEIGECVSGVCQDRYGTKVLTSRTLQRSTVGDVDEQMPVMPKLSRSSRFFFCSGQVDFLECVVMRFRPRWSKEGMEEKLIEGRKGADELFGPPYSGKQARRN